MVPGLVGVDATALNWQVNKTHKEQIKQKSEKSCALPEPKEPETVWW